MIVGIEGIHTWHTGLVLNDRSTFPRIWLTRCELRHAADFEPVEDKIPGRVGTVPRRGDRAGKAVLYEGELQAQNLPGLRDLEADFIAAFSGTDEGRMDSTPHASYTGGLLPSRYFFARPLDSSVPDEQTAPPNRTDYGYMRTFSLALRMSDPRFYDPTEVSEEDTTLEAVGGNPIPFTPDSRVEPASADAFELTLTNPGNAETDGILELHGPCRNPVVSNRSLDEIPFLRFRDLVLDAGEEVTIDSRRQRAERTNGTSVWHKLDPASTWIDRGVPFLQPGPNIIRERAYGFGVGSKLVARCQPADWS